MDTSCCLRHSGMTTVQYLRKALLRRFTFCVFASARLCPPLPIMSTPPLSSLLSVWSPSEVFLVFHVCASQPSCSTSLCFSAPSDPDTSHSDSQGCSINSVHACVCISSQGSVPFSKTFLQVSLASHHLCLCWASSPRTSWSFLLLVNSTSCLASVAVPLCPSLVMVITKIVWAKIGAQNPNRAKRSSYLNTSVLTMFSS